MSVYDCLIASGFIDCILGSLRILVMQLQIMQMR